MHITLELLAATASGLEIHGPTAIIEFTARFKRLENLFCMLPGIITMHDFIERIPYTLTVDPTDGHLYLEERKNGNGNK